MKVVVVKLMHWRLIVDRPPAGLSANGALGLGWNLLEEKDMWFWLVDFVVLPAQALPQVSIYIVLTHPDVVPA